MRRYSLIILGIFLSLKAFCGTNQAAAIFLMIYPGARAVGMGCSFVGVCDDAEATYYNDGGIPFVGHNDVQFMYVKWLPGLWHDMYYTFLSAIKYDEDRAIGIHFIYLNTGLTEGYDEEGNPIGTWTTFDFAVKLSYAMRLSEDVGIGAGAKFIYSFLCPEWALKAVNIGLTQGGTGTAAALDFGLFYKFNEYFKYGIALQNVGSKIKYTESGEGDPLPTALRMGFSVIPLKSEYYSLLWTVEFVKVVIGFLDEIKNREYKYIWDDTWKGMGFELNLLGMFAARAGYFWDTEGAREGWTWGASVGYKSLRIDIGVDAAIYSFKTTNYRLALNYSW